MAGGMTKNVTAQSAPYFLDLGPYWVSPLWDPRLCLLSTSSRIHSKCCLFPSTPSHKQPNFPLWSQKMSHPPARCLPIWPFSHLASTFLSSVSLDMGNFLCLFLMVEKHTQDINHASLSLFLILSTVFVFIVSSHFAVVKHFPRSQFLPPSACSSGPAHLLVSFSSPHKLRLGDVE